MTRRPMQVSFMLVTATLAVACERAPVWARLSAAGVDTLVINSTKSIAMPGTLAPFWLLGPVSWRVAPAGVAHVTHPGAVACDTTGDATVTASNWFVRRSALLLCRPVRAFSFMAVRLSLDGPPYKVVVPNRGLDGRPVSLLAGTAIVDDTSVVSLKDGYVYPRALGKTWVRMDFSGSRTAMGVEVIDTLTAGPVTLAGGEIRSWPLPHGRYEINVAPARQPGAKPFAIMILNANCAKGELGPQHYYCVTYETGALAIRNGAAVGPASDRTANVMILRQAW